MSLNTSKKNVMQGPECVNSLNSISHSTENSIITYYH